MSGRNAPRTLTVTPLPAEGVRSIDSFSVARICDPASFSELLGAFRKVEAEHRQQGRCLLTLDDVDQCLYTSMHALEAHHLDDGIDYPEHDDPAARAAYDAALFRAVSAALRDPVRARTWDEVSLFTEPSDIDALVALNRDPGLVLDDVHMVQCLPADDDTDLLANIPNGYFKGDWTPFDCHAVARRIGAQHGYALFGIGASTLGFHSAVGLEERDLPALVADLQHLYGYHDSPAWTDLATVLRSSPVLLLGYTEGFAEATEASS